MRFCSVTTQQNDFYTLIEPNCLIGKEQAKIDGKAYQASYVFLLLLCPGLETMYMYHYRSTLMEYATLAALVSLWTWCVPHDTKSSVPTGISYVAMCITKPLNWPGLKWINNGHLGLWYSCCCFGCLLIRIASGLLRRMVLLIGQQIIWTLTKTTPIVESFCNHFRAGIISRENYIWKN